MNAIGRVQRDPHPSLEFQPFSPRAVRPTEPQAPLLEASPERPSALQKELRDPPEKAPVAVRPLADRDRLLFTLTNDNWLSMIGMDPGTGFGAGDDFGFTHGFNVELRLCREDAHLYFGLSSELYTRETNAARTTRDEKPLIAQHAVEITKLYFAIEMSPRSEGYTRLYSGVGLRNPQREIPGLAMWCQQALHGALPRAPVFDNRPLEEMQPFLEVGGAIGAQRELPGISENKLRIRGEIGATLNTIFSGSRAFALAEAELPIAGALRVRGAQLAEILAGQKFSFTSSAGLFLEFPAWMIGAQAKIPTGAGDDQFGKFNDRDPLLELRVEVGL